MGDNGEEEEMKLSKEEVKRAIAGIDLTAAGDLLGWLVFAVVATVLTVVMVLLIIVSSRWGGSS